MDNDKKNYYITHILRIITRLFYIVPVKKGRVVITSFNGRQYSCNPKYITEALAQQNSHEVIYALRKGKQFVLPVNIHRVDYRSLTHFYYLMTAQYIIINSSGVTGLLPYRKTQTLINTWHGVAFKPTGNDAFTGVYQQRLRKISGLNTDIYLSSCENFTAHQSMAQNVALSHFLNIGMPRNDIFFRKSEEIEAIKAKVRSYFRIPVDNKVVLYAPTYRDGAVKSLAQSHIDIIAAEDVIQALNDRFGQQFVFLFRAHHDMLPDSVDTKWINASDYPDMQELLCLTDVYITDYSSAMWDYALQYKPGFLFAPDLEQYESTHRFWSPKESWPYPIAKSNAELIQLIERYDSVAQSERIRLFFESMQNYEKGTATTSLLKMME